MKWINQVKPNGFFYIGILIMILNVVFWDCNILLTMIGSALVFFSDTITNSMNSCLKAND